MRQWQHAFCMKRNVQAGAQLCEEDDGLLFSEAFRGPTRRTGARHHPSSSLHCRIAASRARWRWLMSSGHGGNEALPTLITERFRFQVPRSSRTFNQCRMKNAPCRRSIKKQTNVYGTRVLCLVLAYITQYRAFFSA